MAKIFNKNSIFLLIATLLLCVTCMVTALFAYFYDIKEKQTDDFSNIGSNANVIEITTEKEFILNATDLNDNSQNQTSEAENRKTLKLTSDVKLNNDLFITADCHINLNNHVIILNGHSITVDHNYYGSFVIENGVLDVSSEIEKLYIFTPNATAKINNILVKSGTQTAETIDDETFTNSDYIIDISNNENSDIYTAYRVLYFVGERINAEISSLKRYSYETVVNSSNLTNGVIGFSHDLYLPLREDSPFLSPVSDDYSAIITQDISLPKYYKNSNIKINYTSSDTNVLSNDGKIGQISSTQKVTLTVDLIKPKEEIAFASFQFTVFVLDTSNADDCVKAGLSYFKQYMSDYYVELDTDDDNTPDWFGYRLDNSVQFEKSFAPYGVNFDFNAFNEEGLPVNSSFETDGDFIVFTPLKATAKLTVTVNKEGATSQNADYNIKSLGVATIESNYTIAKGFFNTWGIGSEIKFTDYLSTLDLTTYTYNANNDAYPELSSKGITKVSYSLVNNNNGNYELISELNYDILSIVDGHYPDAFIEAVILVAEFEFNLGGNVRIETPIIFELSGQSESQVHEFLAIYTEFERQIISKTGGYTISDFEMPFYYKKKYICFEFANIPQNAIQISLYYNGTEHYITPSSNQTYSEALDDYLNKNSITLSDLRNLYSDIAWRFKMDTDKIPSQNTTITISYRYKNTPLSDWKEYTSLDSSNTTAFVLAGVARCLLKDGTLDANGFADENLYKWVYDNFNINGYTYNLSTNNSEDYKTKILFADWLKKNIEFTNTASDNLIITQGYKGIQFLDGTKRVVISDNSGITSSDFEYFAGMANIETLIISNLGLTDLSDTNSPASDNGLIKNLSSLVKLKYLDISNNDIYKFDGLEDLTALETAYVYKNVFTDVNSVFYGSNGLRNLSIFDIMAKNGTLVYNEIAGGEPQKFGTLTINDYINLSGVEYQEKLPQNVSIIGLIYSNGFIFSVNKDDYALDSSYKYSYYLNSDALSYATVTVTNWELTWGYSGSNGNDYFRDSATGNWYYTDSQGQIIFDTNNYDKTSTQIVLKYTCTLSGYSEPISMNVKFKVTRV